MVSNQSRDHNGHLKEGNLFWKKLRQNIKHRRSFASFCKFEEELGVHFSWRYPLSIPQGPPQNWAMIQMIHGLWRSAKWLNWLGRRLHFATLSCFVSSCYNRSAFSPQTNIGTKNYLNTQRWPKTFFVCVFLFIDLKIFASPGESGSTQETCLPTPSSKRWAVLKLLVTIMFNWLNAVVYVCGSSGAAHFNFQVFFYM